MFNYFLPGLTKAQVAPGETLDRDVLARVGLADVLSDCTRVPQHASVSDVRKGCGGQAGCVIAPVRKHKGEPGTVFSHDLMTWKAVTGYWIGWENNVPVSPQDLERLALIGGSEVADDGGRTWLIPIARAPHHGYEFGALPQSYTFGDDGEPTPHLVPSHAWLWELAGQIRDWYLAEAGPEEDATPLEKAQHERLPFTQLVKYAARILGVNYRLGPAELNVLHWLGAPVLTQAMVHRCCQTTYGWEVLEQAKKKPPASASAAAPSSSASTTIANTPDGAPVIALAEAP